MRIELLVIENCPNSALAAERLGAALEALGVRNTTILQHVLKTSAETRGTGFAGSPTIIAGGIDLFPAATTRELACRIYPTPDGLQGAPTVDQLTAALSARGYGQRQANR
ncbi:thioredoxin family protein [Arthrobacter sp. MYb211]|uniref:thioredoxin family protein n=1 Tax=Micrococcaceae TaxID=1268 RepID=UPI000BB82D54|nr:MULTISPECIES: thioredoxin family protein [Micrococcaceae]PCC27948.1 hypothetical protein CIK76_13840 [Glutamicibacter sp. BW80]PRA13287.1 thioredoxin family protein [Arthrobacter sp. MYb221]PRC10484.1 thioredoxin family protein [Arthrobacter sp. MYb211]